MWLQPQNGGEYPEAIDTGAKRGIGFITALTDHIQSAFIPLLEVLPDYRNRGIGKELASRMLAELKGIPAIDIICDPELQSFYRQFGMVPSVGAAIRDYQDMIKRYI
ncbi:GNAT family N-acetyltransferase [Dehalococcoidia bacterium]|nr:GNAT family N-acetyltransferase [Dehalococcoidia bacterium]